MKTSTLSFLMGALMLSAGFADELQIPHVTANGTATIEVTPDVMVWSVRVRNKAAQLDSAAAGHTKSIQAAMDFLKGAGVDSETVQTSQMEFGENWEYGKMSGGREKQGYFASTLISFKLTNFGLYKTIWTGLAKMPEVSVESVTYDHTQRIGFQNLTRDKAVLAARDKAAAMANVLGAQIGEPLLLEEVVPSESPWVGNAAVNNLRVAPDGERPDTDNSVSPGKIPIVVRVRAAFKLVPNQK